MNVASGAWRRVASSRFDVPFALTVKSVCGSDAAQSCEGCAAVWITSSSERRVLGEHPIDGVPVADVELERLKGRRRAFASSRSVVARGRRRRAEEVRPHVVVEADHVVARLDEVLRRTPSRSGRRIR